MLINKISVRCALLWFNVFLELILLAGSQAVGDACTENSSNGPGTCKKLIDCQPALTELQQKGVFPQICGYAGTVPIVCCADDIQFKEPVSQTGRPVGEISKEKCKEYAKAVYVKTKNPTVLLGHDKSEGEVLLEDCRIAIKTLIVGGELADIAEFPHMALVGYNDKSSGERRWLCGGSLISEQYVLTAGHCLFARGFDAPKYIRLGVNNIHDTEFRQDFTIAEIIRHPDHKPPSHYNDIAIFKLDRPADFKPEVRPACLYTEHAITHRLSIASGWGKTDFAGDTSEDLYKVVLEFTDTSSCNESFNKQIGRKLSKGIVEETQVCAGSYDNVKRDTCQGDSGGPLQISNTKAGDIYCTYSVVGVTSFGKPCGIVNSSGVYTRVSSYLKWIEDTVWPE